MRILEFSIEGPFKNLKGFSVSFNSDRDISVILGRNGAAKSNLLEALITVFSDISLANKSSFGYTLRYCLGGQEVQISCVAGKLPSFTIGEKRVTLAEFRATHMPRYVVGYYSGQSDRFASLFWKHDAKALEETLAEQNEDRLEFRRFVLARPEHGLFALTAFYFSDDKEAQSFLSDLPRIEEFDSLLITLHKPGWARKGKTVSEFWGAKGPVKTLLQRLLKHSLCPLTELRRVQLDFKKTKTRELLHLYLPDTAALQELATYYGGDAKQLFQALDTMRLSDLLEDFRVRVKVRGSDSNIHTRELSEGEQQLLTVLGLMRFTREQSSLYFLDEPDTHLNPSWGLMYLRLLRQIGEVDQGSHTFLATHDPLLVAGLEKEEIRVLVRGEDGQVAAIQPDESPKGRGVAAALTSELFGLESQFDLDSQETLNEIYRIVDKEELNDADRERLKVLRSELPALIPEDVGDPYVALARRAYEEAQEIIGVGAGDAAWKQRTLQRLREQLVNEASEI
jgi:predicted ATPase